MPNQYTLSERRRRTISERRIVSSRTRCWRTGKRVGVFVHHAGVDVVLRARMRQELHADVPHGPFAFKGADGEQDGKFEFRGGETQIMRPERLHYWKNFDSSQVIERGQIMETIALNFNRLVVFDPRCLTA